MASELMQGVILTVAACIFGTLVGVMYKVDKLQKAIDTLKK